MRPARIRRLKKSAGRTGHDRDLELEKRVSRALAEGYNPHMSKTEILAELPKLKAEELAEVQAKLDELFGEVWLDDGELTDADKATLDAALAEYRKDPDGGGSWEDVKGRIVAKLRP